MRNISGIILAAGGSTRMGAPKQLLEHEGEALVHSALRAAQCGGCDMVCVVTGHGGKAVEKAVADLRPLLVHNEKWERGMGSSIRLGLEAVLPSSAVLLLACDQPAVESEIIRRLIERRDQTGSDIVASYYSATFGIPALFDCSCFGELGRLPDRCGAKAVIEANPTRVAPLDFAAGALDIDSPDDLREWLKFCRNGRTGDEN